ncbi:MAG TPA: hypothetical protein VFT99_23845, partial [Roseiflexaceae bacterium]|nr:hypothetical protein [Roseiflexaceae bacterium]
LTPSLSRTRTVIHCGSSSDTELEGDHATYDVPWQVGQDEKGHTQLALTEAQGVTTYFKDGIAPQMLGTWRRGAVQSEGFYNPATGEFAYPTGKGEWIRFKADGTFERGEVDFEYISDECNRAIVTYQTGTFTGSGSLITLHGTGGMRTRANLCDLNDQTDEQLGAVESQRWTWSLADDGNTLGMIRIEVFRQYTYERES